MASILNLSFFIIQFITYPFVNGCGPIQVGRERTIHFSVTDFKLPAVMVYSTEAADKVNVPSISTTRSEAETFVQRLIMQHVEDILYEQGRSAFLPDSVISSILQQLEVQISYDPLKCENAVIDPFQMAGNGNGAKDDKLNCIIVDEIVTKICKETNGGCMAGMIATKLQPLPPMHLSISGSLKTSNAVMANWSNQMWQSVLNRVLRRISSGTNGKYFNGASIRLA